MKKLKFGKAETRAALILNVVVNVEKERMSTTKQKIEYNILIESIKKGLNVEHYLDYRGLAANLGLVDKIDREVLFS